MGIDNWKRSDPDSDDGDAVDSELARRLAKEHLPSFDTPSELLRFASR